MRVLLVALDSPATLSGGVEWYVHNLALALQQEGHEVRVASRRPKRGAVVPPGVHHDWAQLPALPASHRTRLLLEPAFHRAVRKSAQWADVVHGQNADALGAIDVRPVVATVHTTPLDEWESSRLGGWRERLYQRRIQDALVRRWQRFVPRVAHLWTPSEHVADSLRALGGRAVDILPNPVTPPPRFPKAEARARLGLPEGPIILFVGRLARVKRVDRLLDAMRELPEATAVIAGDGPEDARLRAIAPEGTRFLGRVDGDTRALLLSAADAFCLPSEHEGQPLALIEAMSVGLPVVATRPEWVPDALRDHGLWGDDVASLLREALRRGRGEGAPVADYPTVARQVTEVYERVRNKREAPQ